MEKEYLERLIQVEGREKSNTKRLDEHAKKIDELSDVYIALTKANDKIDNIEGDVTEIKNDIKDIEDKPNKRLDMIWGYVISGIIGIVLGYIAIKLGMK